MDLLDKLSTQDKKAIAILEASGFKCLYRAKIEEVTDDRYGVDLPTFSHAGVYDIALVLETVGPRKADVEAQVEIDPPEKKIKDRVVPNDHQKKSPKKKGGK